MPEEENRSGKTPQESPGGPGKDNGQGGGTAAPGSQIVLGKDMNVIARTRREEIKLEKKREKRLLAKKYIEYLKYIPPFLMFFFSALYSVSLLLCWACSKGVFGPGSPFFGFDLVPVTYILYMGLIALALSLILRRWPVAISVSILFVVFFMFNGDHSIGYKDRVSQKHLEKGKRYSVASLNVAQYDQGYDRVGGALAGVNADFVFLNEINYPVKIGLGFTQMAMTANRMHYHLKGGKICDSAILSRYPIVSFKEISFSSKQPNYTNNTPENNENNRNRYFLHAVARDKDQDINLVSIRLIAGRSIDFGKNPGECIRWGQYLAKTQCKESDEAARYIRGLKGPVIFAGDLNAQPNAFSLKPLYNTGIDTALAVTTFPKPTFPASNPNLRLDYIFCNRWFQPFSSGVDSSVVSDHRIVYSTITLIESKVKEEKRKRDMELKKKKAEKAAREKAKASKSKAAPKKAGANAAKNGGPTAAKGNPAPGKPAAQKTGKSK